MPHNAQNTPGITQSDGGLEEKILLLGFGDIAQRLSQQLLASQVSRYHVSGVRRRSIPTSNVTMYQADCADQAALHDVLQHQFDVIVMTFTPIEISDTGYRQAYVDTVTALLAALQQQVYQPRLLFVSSSSVYGQDNASWVDETSATEPRSFSGHRLLEAEELLAESEYISCCVRFSGIYGPGRRRLIEQVIAGQGVPEEPILYSNRIHADDAAGVLAHLIERQRHRAIDDLYLASDCCPVALHEVQQWLAQQLGYPNDHLTPSASPSRMLRSSKRCSNRRLLESGYQFRYPSFKEGYTQLIADMKSAK